MELLIGAPSAVVDVHVDRLRNSPLYARMRPLIERAGCSSERAQTSGLPPAPRPTADFDWLMAVTERALVGMRTVDDHNEWLAVLVGAYAEQDAERVLAAVAQQTGATGAGARQALGRFALVGQAEFAASVLDSHLAVVGGQAWVRAALAALDNAADQRGASFAGSSLWRDLSARTSCVDRTLCLVAAADSVATRQLQHGLNGVGAKALARELGTADTALGLSIPDGLDVSFVAQLATPDAAEAARRLLKDWLWQAGLVIRLAGLPNVLDAAKLEVNANLLQVALAVDAADLSQYEQRLSDMLNQSGQGCAADVAAADVP